MAEPIHRYQLEGMDGAPDVEITWTHEDQAAALAEGWYLDEEDGAIQHSTEAGYDAPAGQHLSPACYAIRRASAGSELHIRAMILDTWSVLGAWEKRLREATGQMGDWHAP